MAGLVESVNLVKTPTDPRASGLEWTSPGVRSSIGRPAPWLRAAAAARQSPGGNGVTFW